MNYAHIARAVDYYRNRGYVYIEDAPWTVEQPASYATKPEGATEVRGGPENAFLVASGEQSFLQLMLEGRTLKRAICVTPCWRIEKYNDWHKPYFMKAELINAHDVDEGHLVHMVHEASSFFEQFFPVRVLKIGKTYDIVEKGTRAELGSYGIRDVKIEGERYRWIYGTGCAEPRLSTVIARHSDEVGK